MSYFFWASLILVILTVLFAIVFSSLAYYWHEKRQSVMVVPLLYTFEFFITAFFILFLLAFLLQYLPNILQAFSQS